MSLPYKKAPLISVLITCYKRKEFIINAIESVLCQTIDRSSYEIIVSINYRDLGIDNFLIENHCKIIYDERSGIGLRLAGLISAAESDILVFLEDDDYFKSNKLEEISNIFRNPDINYVNNSYLTIDYNGNYLSDSHNYLDGNAWMVSTPAVSFSILRKLLEKKAFFSMSNISIRKSMILEYIGELSKIKVIPDFFSFVVALQSKGNLLYYPISLTTWRFHSSTSVASGTRIEFLTKRKDFWLNVTSDLELLSLITQNILLKKLIYCLYSEAITHDMVLGTPKANSLELIIRVTKSLVLLRNKHIFIIFLLALAVSIFPVKASLAYFSYLLSKAPTI